MSSPPRSAYVAWLAICLIWGTTYLAIRVALETVPPFLMGAVRWVIAGGILLIGLKIRGVRLPSPSHWPALTLLGILLIGFGNGGVVWAERTVPSGLTAVLVAVIPFWMVAVERVMGGHDHLSGRRLAGLVIGFLGIVLLVWPEMTTGGGGRPFLYGVVATQLACIGWAIGSGYSRRRHAGENVLAAAALQMVFGGLCMLVLSVAAGEWASAGLTIKTGSALVYLIVVGSVAGFPAYAYALKHLPIAIVSLYAYVNPVIAVLLGTLILGEALSPRLAASAGVVLIGMLMVRK